ncbi:MAG: hypothetical protein ABSA44_12950 [Bacteroidota bacterium]
MKFIKSSIVLSVVFILSSVGWNGCYVQFATNSDVSEEPDDSNQPPPLGPIIADPMPYPVYPHPGGPYYPHPVEPPYIPPSHIGALPPKSGTEPTADPHRQSGDQRPSNPGQSTGGRTESPPSRTSWSPAPAPQNPPASSTSNTRTSGSTRR